VLALQLELCLPKLVSSPAPRRARSTDFGLSAGILAAGPVQRVYSSDPPRFAQRSAKPSWPTPYEEAESRPMSDLMAKIRKWLGLDKKS
jgi:hypothetical protein